MHAFKQPMLYAVQSLILLAALQNDVIRKACCARFQVLQLPWHWIFSRIELTVSHSALVICEVWLAKNMIFTPMKTLPFCGHMSLSLS